MCKACDGLHRYRGKDSGIMIELLAAGPNPSSSSLEGKTASMLAAEVAYILLSRMIKDECCRLILNHLCEGTN